VQQPEMQRQRPSLLPDSLFNRHLPEVPDLSQTVETRPFHHWPEQGRKWQEGRQRLVTCSKWFSRATLSAMPLWLLTYKFTCSQAECGYHNALDAVAQADTPKTAASQVGKSQHLCGRCGRPLTDSSSLKMAVPVPISSEEKKRSVSESGKQPSQNRGSG